MIDQNDRMGRIARIERIGRVDRIGRILRGDREIRLWSRRPVLADIALWVFTTAFCLSVNSPTPFLSGRLAVALGVVAVAGAFSRRLPSVSLAIGIGLAQWDGRYYGIVALVAFLAALRTGRLRPLAWAPALAVPALFVGGVAAGMRPLGALTAELLFSVAVPWLVGRNLRQRRALAAAGWERARHLEHEREMHADRARMRERARIAQDMHDSLGHDLSLLALRAAVLEVDPALPEAQRAAAADLRAGAAAATDRLHEIIGVLQTDNRAAPTEPVHESIEDLVARSRESGMSVVLERTGRAPESPALALAVHRVVRESLTNAAKHAPGAKVRVTLAYRDDSAEVRVSNGEPPAGSALADRGPAPGSRSGLIALRERVRLAGGTFTAAPRAAGFEVTARLPAARSDEGRPDPGPPGSGQRSSGQRSSGQPDSGQPGSRAAVGSTSDGLLASGSPQRSTGRPVEPSAEQSVERSTEQSVEREVAW
ncbi:ATP-binding protein [Yinghuangia sp. YIM S09857]|uniref:sensor histidine kinase n=1 Tax=Yinghuangia sp. YIM S09857 TaxID=3436929 RepID=UPI003F538F21